MQTDILALPNPNLRITPTPALPLMLPFPVSIHHPSNLTVSLTLRRNQIPLLINLHPLRRHLDLHRARDTLHDRLPRALHDLLLARLAAHALEVLEVVVVDRGHVLAAEDADLEALGGRVARRERGAGGFQVRQGLVDDCVGADDARDV